jgi:hypothetical protein
MVATNLDSLNEFPAPHGQLPAFDFSTSLFQKIPILVEKTEEMIAEAYIKQRQ